MLFKNVSFLDENFELRENCFIGTAGGKIGFIGESEPLDAAPYLKEGGAVEGKGLLLMPAFYNTHAHSAMTLMRGYGEGLSLQDWLNKRIFPFEDHLDDNAVYRGTMLAVAESLASGIVGSTDMYYFCEGAARAVEESGAKMNISRTVVHFDDSDPREGVRYKEMVDFIRRFDGKAEERIKAEAALHAEYTSTPETAKAVGEAALELNAGLQVHVSETKKEHEECKERHGKTPVRYFADLGMLDPRTTAAHCVWLEEEDMDILAEKGVFVSSCPASNMKLASGIANVPEMIKRGVKVTIGTDSVASNNSLNFFEEMKLLALGAKIKSGDPAVLSPKEVLKMATRGGALAQGRDDCGLIKEGYRADLVAIDTGKVCMQPVHDSLTNLVYSADPGVAALTMCDGRVLYERGEFKTIDIEKAVFELDRAVNKILGML